MRLASTRLTVDEECSIETVENVVHQWQRRVLEDLVLGAFLIEDAAKFEFTRLLGLIQVERHKRGQPFSFLFSYFDAAEVLLGRSVAVTAPCGEDFGNLVTAGTAEA